MIENGIGIRHLSQTPEEFSKEMNDSVSWFIKALGKPIKIVDKAESGVTATG